MEVQEGFLVQGFWGAGFRGTGFKVTGSWGAENGVLGFGGQDLRVQCKGVED